MPYKQTALAIGFVFLICLGGCSKPTEEAATSNFDQKVKPGPWGELEISYIQISPPIDYIPELRIIPDNQIWRFPGWDRQTLLKFLDNNAIGAQTRQALRLKIAPDPENNGVMIRPSEEEIINLGPGERAYIYNQLSAYKINRAHDKVHRYAGSSLDEWLNGAKISGSTRDMLDKLVYRNGGLLFFVDLPILMRRIESVEERQELFRALSREKTMLIKLRIGDDSNLRAIAEYWGRGVHAKDIYPLLESLRNRPGERSIDIVHLMPPFARRHLFMFPHIYDDADESTSMRDCHWTTFNFFNLALDNSYSTAAVVKKTIETGYHKIEPAELRFGDVILYLEGNHLLHSAVFLAGDIVFTKNGTNFSSPWMFMHMPDLENYYARNNPLKIMYLRKKSQLQMP